MSATKVTVIFLQTTSNSSNLVERFAGWGESYYSTLAIDNAILQSQVTVLCNLRAALLANNCSITGQRFQTVDPIGPSLALENKFPPGAGGANDLPGVALRWQCDGANVPNRRTVILRGIPDARIVTGEYTPSLPFSAAAQQFFAHLTTVWRFRAIDRTIQPVKIVSITNNVMTTVAPHGLVVGDTVNIMSAVKTADFKKTSYQAKVILQPNATTVNLFPLGDLLACPDTVKGQARKVVIHYPAMTIPPAEVTNPRATHRDTGSPSGGFRGRQSTRR